MELEDDRQLIIFSSSTLHNTILDRNIRTHRHIDIETICGGKTVDLYKTWQAIYSNSTKPCDIIVISGVNDVPSTPVSDLRDIFNKWSFELTRQNQSSTLRVCRMITPPAKAWFPSNGPLPLTNYVNHMTMINSINDMITNINQLNSHDWVIGFSREGCRSVSRGGERKTSHNFGAWREIALGKHKCLHLNDRHRSNMMRKLLNYIKQHITQ
jgi:hypothetical protein